eukprot:14954116-Heterocapsa_arctica.AAC.1
MALVRAAPCTPWSHAGGQACRRPSCMTRCRPSSPASAGLPRGVPLALAPQGSRSSSAPCRSSCTATPRCQSRQ